jgi:hypothetical protein
MTESEWLASEDPAAMLRHLTCTTYEEPTYGGTTTQSRSKPLVSDRKLRLFCVACACRMKAFGAPIIPAARKESHYPAASSSAANWAHPLAWDANFPQAEKAALLRCVVGNPFLVVERKHRHPGGGSVWSRKENPGPGRRLLTIDDAWLTPTVLSLAQAAYEERLPGGTLDPLRLAVLADALEESGCTDEAILRHLRGWEQVPGGAGSAWVRWDGGAPHVRGCWALSLILNQD